MPAGFCPILLIFVEIFIFLSVWRLQVRLANHKNVSQAELAPSDEPNSSVTRLSLRALRRNAQF